MMARMSYDTLREHVWRANLDLVRHGLVVLTWGNASGVDRAAGVMAIKPSGVAYDALRPGQIVVVALADGQVVEGSLRPSSDTPTHLALYRAFAGAGGVVHTHSRHATAWAQAGRDLPCLGTTHADHFRGAVPVTRPLRPGEIAADYEAATGAVIVETFASRGLDPAEVPGVLVHGHGPFAWGASPAQAVVQAVVLEEVARMGLATRALRPEADGIDGALLDRHFGRKHGPDASYGQGDGG